MPTPQPLDYATPKKLQKPRKPPAARMRVEELIILLAVLVLLLAVIAIVAPTA